MKFPIMIKDGASTITFISADCGTYENGTKCMSSLEDIMVRVEAGSASIITILKLTEIQTNALQSLIEMHMSYLVEHDVENDSPLNNFIVFEEILEKINPDYLS